MFDESQFEVYRELSYQLTDDMVKEFGAKLRNFVTHDLDWLEK